MLQSSSSEKKLVKPLKNCFFGPNLHRKGVIMGYAQDGKKFFLAEITKADHQLSESFYFIKISYVLTELWIFFYLEWCFLSKKCHFQPKQLWLVRLETWKIITHNNTLTAWPLLVSGFLPCHLPVSPNYIHTYIRVSYTTALFISSHQRERG